MNDANVALLPARSEETDAMEAEALDHYLCERPALVLTILDIAEQYARESRRPS